MRIPKLFQIWLGPPPQGRVLEFMQENRKNAGEYHLVSESKFIDADFYHDAAAWIMRLAKECSEALEHAERVNDPRILSDYLRILFLRDNPSFVYLDCDAKITQDFAISPGRTYFGEKNDGGDIYAIWGAGDRTVFDAMLTALPWLIKAGANPFYNYLRAWRDIIPMSCLTHLEASKNVLTH